jgi:glycosyltransferase involved in cell wall biosynthesis
MTVETPPQMKSYKVALVHNIMAPYRVPLFAGLAQHPALDLHVFYCSRTVKLRKWDILGERSYAYKVLPGITLEYKTLEYHVNPSIVSQIVSGKYDVVIIGGSGEFTMQAAFLISKALKLPVILWAETFEGGQPSLAKFVGPLTRYIIRNVDALIVPGSRSRDFHIKRGAASEKVFIAPNIVNNDAFFAKSSAFKQQGAHLKNDLHLDSHTIVLFVGQLVQRKGVGSLLRAFTRLKSERESSTLVVIGDGELKSELMQLVSNESMTNIIFTGWISEEEKVMYYAIADVFVLPTLQDLCPLVINEAMACGLPVVSTTAAGCAPDMIFNWENGFIVEPGNVDALYEAMLRIVRDNELRQQMGRKSYEILTTRFSLDNAVNGFLDAIRFACDSASSQ